MIKISLMIPDIVIITGVLFYTAWSNWALARKEKFLPLYRNALMALWLFHLGFAIAFYAYITHHGGDAMGYWNLTADRSQGAADWMGHWGHGTFFLQWLNYLPSRYMGLHFFTANILYASLSFIGFRELFLMLKNQIHPLKGDWLTNSWLFILFLPGLHFWSAGAGKESLLWLGLVLALKGFVSLKAHWKAMVLGILLTFWVRPLNGVVLLLLFVLSRKDIQTYYRLGVLSLILIFIWLFGSQVLYITHVENLSWSAIMEVSNAQLRFLQEQAAGSEVPMGEYPWYERLWTVLFRPFWGDVHDFWSFAGALENTFILLFLLSALAIGLVKGGVKIPWFLWAGAGYGIILTLVHTLTLNNLGILMRMKSTYTVFFLLLAWYAVFGTGKHCSGSGDCRGGREGTVG